VRSTTELADLTREIFDLAVVSERSPRRGPVERLLKALGTPFESPHRFLHAEPGASWTGVGSAGAPEATRYPTPHAGANGPGAGAEDAPSDGLPWGPTFGIGEGALADLTIATEAPSGSAAVATHREKVETPRLDDRSAVERAIRAWAHLTGAAAAGLWGGAESVLECRGRTGGEDAMLEALIRHAMRTGEPRVVAAVEGDDRGRSWGAWPFTTPAGRMVLAAAGIDSTECDTWQRAANELAVAARAPEPQAPAEAAAVPGWLAPDSFRRRLELALERNRRDGHRFAIHRIGFGDAADAVENLVPELPRQLRGTDFLCRPAPCEIVLLTAGTPAAFGHVRRRLIALWEEAWRRTGGQGPAPPLTGERCDLVGSEDGDGIKRAADRWLTDS
jgi:hypothetical protein